jgi:hypothetical protein
MYIGISLLFVCSEGFLPNVQSRKCCYFLAPCLNSIILQNQTINFTLFKTFLLNSHGNKVVSMLTKFGRNYTRINVWNPGMTVWFCLLCPGDGFYFIKLLLIELWTLLVIFYNAKYICLPRCCTLLNWYRNLITKLN